MSRHSGLTISNAWGSAPSLWRRWRQFTRYHGVWTFGIRLLRDLSLVRKTVVLGACLLLPVGIGLMDTAARHVDSLRTTEHAARDAHLFALTATLHHQVLLLSGTPSPATRDAHAQALAELSAALATAAPLPAPVARSWAGLQASASAGQLAEERLALARFMSDLEATGVIDREDVDSKALQHALGTDLMRLTDALTTLSTVGAEPAEARPSLLDVGLVVEARLRLERVVTALDASAAATVVANLHQRAWERRASSFLQAREALAAGASPAPDTDGLAQAGRQAVGELLALQDAGLSELRSRLAARVDDARHRAWQGAVLVALCALVSGYLLVCMYKVMRGGLAALCGHLALVGAGNLAREPVGLGKDEIGQALTSLGLSVRGMAALFSVVNQGVAAVSHAAREVAAGNGGLAVRTSEIRADIGGVSRRAQEFAGAMNDCGALVDNAAEHVRVVRDETQRSRRAMLDLRGRMRSLQGKSHEITKIVDLMEATAYQTKLLSLNASVEASRAGEAGKGFSIVAAEVRALAQRSHDAAQRIRGIVGASIDDIEDGNVMTDRAMAGVQATFEVTEAVDRVMGDIVSLTQAGLADSREMRTAARQVEQALEGNARLVAQLSEASTALRREGDKLKRSVHAFVFE